MTRTATLVAMLSLTACSMDPKLGPTPLPVPPSWPVGDPYLLRNEAPLPTVTYRDVFRDPRLQSLIVQALANNRNLRVAAANIAAARAQVRITRANQFPQLNATGSTTTTSRTGTSTSSTPGTPSTATGRTVTTNYALDLSIPAFEVDLFGRLASLTRADQQRLFATEAAARAVRLALVGEIADAWLFYAADSSLLTIAEQTAASAQISVVLTKARLDGGIAPKTDLLQAQQVLELALQNVAQQRTARAQDVNLLQLLVGAPISPLNLPPSIEQAAPTIAALPAGLDSRVLLRRPDVVQAEYLLYAANAEIGAARAALFPTISLTGLLGFASTALGSLFSGGAFTWSVGTNATYPIFRAGAGRANVALTEAQRNAALASYELAIQTAFSEVANALAERGTIDEQLRASGANVAAAAESLRLEDARYRAGIDPYLSLLIAQRLLYTAQQAQVVIALAEGSNAVALYTALGADSFIAQGPIG
jgi:multidrug efflux system outer membrane protein